MEIRQLSDEERSALAEGLELAARMVQCEQPLSVDQVQELYEALSKDHPDFVEGVIAVGLAFGETIIAKAGYEWVRATDEFGEETALSPKEIQIVCAPVSMIQKRMARREEVEVAQLRDETIRTLQDLIDSGNYKKR